MQANSTKTTIQHSLGHLSPLVFALILISSGAFGAEKTSNSEKGSQVKAQDQASQSSSRQSEDFETRRPGNTDSQDAQYGSYEDWLDNNPRYSHPVHDMVHRNSWSEQVRRNRERDSQARRSNQDQGQQIGDYEETREERRTRDRDSQAQRPNKDQGQQLGDYEEPRVIGPDDITYDRNNWDKFYPYPRSRVIWYNERYYSGRYYQDPNQKDRRSDRGVEQEGIESPEGEPVQFQGREGDRQYKEKPVRGTDSTTGNRVESETDRIDEPIEGVSRKPGNQTSQANPE